MNPNLPRNNYPAALAWLQQLFHFSVSDCLTMIPAFIEQMETGLAGRPGTLKMLPTYIPLPTGREEGVALAVDLGGSNLRVMVIRLSPGLEQPQLLLARKRELASEEMNRDAHTLFAILAREVNNALGELAVQQPELSALEDLGFTFSYPVQMVSHKSGKIVNLAKQLTASGLIGQDPFVLLCGELAALPSSSCRFPLNRLMPKALLNDTVTELIYGAYLKLAAGSPYACRIGGIIGTGNNFAIVTDTQRLAQFDDPAYPFDRMIINLESGNFTGPCLKRNLYDEIVDHNSTNKGSQHLEKMIAGNYLGKIAAAILRDLAAAGYLFSGNLQAVAGLDAFDCRHMSGLAAAFPAWPGRARDILAEINIHRLAEVDLRIINDIAALVSTRSARIAGANVAALVRFLDPELATKHTIAIDGSVFGKYPGYKRQMEQVLREIYREKAAGLKLEYIPDGSGIGAAIAARR